MGEREYTVYGYDNFWRFFLVALIFSLEKEQSHQVRVSFGMEGSKFKKKGEHMGILKSAWTNEILYVSNL